MFDWGRTLELKALYAAVFGPDYRFDHDHHHVSTRPAGLLRIMEVVKNDLGFLLLNAVAATPAADHPAYAGSGAEWDVTYHLFQLESHQRLQVHLLYRHGDVIPSVRDLYPPAARAEAEALARVRGVAPAVAAPLEMPVPPGNVNLSEPPLPHELHQWFLFDLLHPMMRGEAELALETDEGRVLRAWYHTGHWRRGWESRAHAWTPLQAATLLEGLHPQAVPLTAVAWSKTVEDYFRWRVPERAQAIRMVFMELGRAHHHVGVLARLAADLGQPEAVQACREVVERLRHLFRLYSGARMVCGPGGFGGLTHDLPPGWTQECASTVQALQALAKLYLKLVLRNPLHQRRLGGAAISAHQALQAGLTGPALRATGVNFDLRKSRPFYFYTDIDFEVPVGVRGATHDRALVLCEEIVQAARIAAQVMDNLPLGAVQADAAGLDEFNRGVLPPAVWEQWCREADRAFGGQWTAVEGPDGELGFHAVLHPSRAELWSLHVKTGGSWTAQAVPVVLTGCPLPEVATALTSLALTASAVDR
jgi:NADH:ubiquinone oxidoreductase subunit D